MKNIYNQITSLRWKNNRSLSVKRFSYGCTSAQKILPFCLRKQRGSMESYNIFRGFLLSVFLYTELIHIVSFVVDGYDYGQFLYT